MSTILLKNIGTIVSGNIMQPILEGNAILVRDGLIAKVGNLENVSDGVSTDSIIDVNGMTVCPGLIDAHVHPLLTDFVPDMKAVDWFDSYVHGGVTGLVSLGEVCQPGRPTDALGAKAFTITSKKIFENYRPSGLKVDAGAIMMEPGLTKEDFLELAQAGCSKIGEVGMGTLRDSGAVEEMTKWAKEAGLMVIVHAGGPSRIEGKSYSIEEIIALTPDVVAHLNGAPTPPPGNVIKSIVQDTDAYFDLIDGGHVKSAITAVNEAMAVNALSRVMLGTNAPSMSGFAPTGLWMLMGTLCAYTDLRPEQAVAMATGNPSTCYSLPGGFIAEGKPADLVVIDAAIGSIGEDALSAIKAGDLIGLALSMIDGKIVVWQSRNTTPPRRNYMLVK